MIDRVKHFWEKLALVVLVLIFILFEVRLIIVVSELYIEIIFGIVNFFLCLHLIKNLKSYADVKWKKE